MTMAMIEWRERREFKHQAPSTKKSTKFQAPIRTDGRGPKSRRGVMALLLAIDQSTSATKALLYDATGKLLGKEAVEHRQIYPQPGWVEHDAEEIWQNTIEAVRRLIGNHAEAAGELLCLSLTNQRETVVVFERGRGRPLRNAIVWQCRRGDAICAELKGAGHGGGVTQLTGLRAGYLFFGVEVEVVDAAGAGVGGAAGKRRGIDRDDGCVFDLPVDGWAGVCDGSHERVPHVVIRYWCAAMGCVVVRLV